MGMIIFRLIASPPKRIQLLLSQRIPPCVCKLVSEVMYQHGLLVVSCRGVRNKELRYDEDQDT